MGWAAPCVWESRVHVGAGSQSQQPLLHYLWANQSDDSNVPRKIEVPASDSATSIPSRGSDGTHDSQARRSNFCADNYLKKSHKNYQTFKFNCDSPWLLRQRKESRGSSTRMNDFLPPRTERWVITPETFNHTICYSYTPTQSPT